MINIDREGFEGMTREILEALNKAGLAFEGTRGTAAVEAESKGAANV